MKKLYFAVVMLLTAATISAESEWCNRIIGHFDPTGEGTKDAKSYVRLTVQDNKNGTITFTVAADPTIDATLGEGKAAPDVDYILINPGYGTAGTDVEADAPTSQSVTWTVPEGTTVLPNVEILWSFSNFPGRYMVQGLSIPLDEICGAAATEIEDEIAPVMVDASVAEVTYNSITLNVSGTDKTTADGQVEAVNKFVIDGTTYTAENGQIKIEKLTAGTQYTFQVYAKDLAGNVSENSVTVSATTETRISDCEGQLGHFATPDNKRISYTIQYKNNAVVYTVSALNGKVLDFCEIQTNKGNFAVPIANDVATYTQEGLTIGEELAVRFLYSTDELDGNDMTSNDISLGDPNIVYYKVGDCDQSTTLLPVVDTQTSVRKVIRDGQLYIIRDGVRYNVMGNVIR